MAFIKEIQDAREEGSEHVQLDDYYIDDDDYISGTPGSNPDVAGAFADHELPSTCSRHRGYHEGRR
jgi:hypothetical protein